MQLIHMFIMYEYFSLRGHIKIYLSKSHLNTSSYIIIYVYIPVYACLRNYYNFFSRLYEKKIVTSIRKCNLLLLVIIVNNNM